MVSIATGEAGAELTIASAPEQMFCMPSTVLGGSHVFSLLILLKARVRGYCCHWVERGRTPGAGRAKHESPEPQWRRMKAHPGEWEANAQKPNLLDPGFGGVFTGCRGNSYAEALAGQV